jgi:hypothetical protein
MPRRNPFHQEKPLTLSSTTMTAQKSPIIVPAAAKRTDWRTQESVTDLLASLRFRRPRGGPTEQKFIREYLDAQIDDLKQDEIGNIYKIVGPIDPKIMWSSHTDSVHRLEGEQHVIVDGDWVRLPKNSKSNCLGADDMAGIWIMRKMIQAGVPGMYVFHYGEESGCMGSKWVAKNKPEYLKGIQAAIAFDRRDFGDVITHQLCGRSASDAFAASLCNLLPEGYLPSPNGIYTDTASYADLIPECTNVSVGYQNEHGTDERLNIPHILKLADKLCSLTADDLDTLVIARDPKEIDFEDSWYGSNRYYSTSGWMGGANAASNRRREERSNGTYRGKYGGKWQHLGSAYDNDDLNDEPGDEVFDRYESVGSFGTAMPKTMEDLLSEYPRSIGRILEAYGFSVEDLWEELQRDYNSGR